MNMMMMYTERQHTNPYSDNNKKFNHFCYFLFSLSSIYSCHDGRRWHSDRLIMISWVKEQLRVQKKNMTHCYCSWSWWTTYDGDQSTTHCRKWIWCADFIWSNHSYFLLCPFSSLSQMVIDWLIWHSDFFFFSSISFWYQNIFLLNFELLLITIVYFLHNNNRNHDACIRRKGRETEKCEKNMNDAWSPLPCIFILIILLLAMHHHHHHHPWH